MHFISGLSVGLGVGVLAGGFLAYKYADILVAKAVKEYHKAVALEERFRRAL